MIKITYLDIASKKLTFQVYELAGVLNMPAIGVADYYTVKN